jgi:V8-like Glu-specific endopeptidase
MTTKAPHPLTPEELVAHDNQPASKTVPPDVAHRLAAAQPIFSLPGKAPKAEPRLETAGPGSDAWRLPEGAILGTAGMPLKPLSVPEKPIAKVEGASTKGHRPEWADLVYHPKRSFEPPWARRPTIKRGRRGELFWGVYGADDRQVYYPSGYPWRCVGRVFVWNDASAANWSWWGSAVLVGPRQVLTAGHVVPWSSVSWKALFVPGYYDGSSVSGAGAQSWVSNAHGWDVSFRSGLPNAYDLAVLRINDPLGNSLGWFGTRVYTAGGQIIYYNVSGYPAMIASGDRPSYQPGITVLDTDPNGGAMELEHHGDTTGGDSGAPFWAMWSDGFPYAVGVVSGGMYEYEAKEHGYEDNNICAGGQAMIDIVNWAHSNWT